MGIFKKSVVGIEIDTTEIRAVNLSGSSDKPQLLSYGRQSLKKGIVKDGAVLEPKMLVEAIIGLWETNNIRSRDIIFGINNQDVIIRFASIPKVPDNKIGDLIRFQSEEYIPIPFNDIELDYSVLGDDNSIEPPQTRVLLVASRKKILFEYINIIQQARLNVLDIGVSMLSLNRLIPNALNSLPLAVVNLSNDSGSIVIGDGKELGFARTFQYDNAMREAIREYLSSSASTRYLMGETKLATISSFLANEISSSVIYYQNKHPDVSVQNLAITGGISQTKGLILQLSALLGINVTLFGYLKNGEGSNDKSFYAPGFAVCTSLALRGLEV